MSFGEGIKEKGKTAGSLHFLQSLLFKGSDESFPVEIKGLGSWQTRGGNLILYGDFTQLSQSTSC